MPNRDLAPASSRWISRTLVCAVLSASVPQVALAADATIVRTGGDNGCIVTTTGAMQCWGANSFGQLGDDTFTARATPGDVPGLGGGVVAITAGTTSCAVLSTGGVKCWGFNGRGEVGDGTTVNRRTPVDVVGLTNAVAVAGGGATCALTSTGGVKCWGWNQLGAVGDGSGMQQATPVDVSGLTSGVTAISVGDTHTCALLVGGGVKCWGGNFSGQVGDGTTTNRPTPVDVSGLGSGVAAISAGAQHTCARMATGAVKCWGANFGGQIGDGTVGTDRVTPVDVVGIGGDVAALEAGWASSCVVLVGGSVRCWGGSDFGQLGDGSTAARPTPGDVPGLAGVTAVSARGPAVCALTSSGSVKCWGRNYQRALGDGVAGDSHFPVSVLGVGPCSGDADGDGRCDDNDACVNVAGARFLAAQPKPRLVIARVTTDPMPLDDKLTIRGQFDLPAGVGFGSLDPRIDGVRLQLRSGGEARFDQRIATGAYAGRDSRGWTRNGTGRQWTFRDTTGFLDGGIGKVVLTDRSRGALGGRVQFVIVGKGGFYPGAPGDEPVQAALTLGKQAASIAGKCGESDFDSGDCAFNGAATTLTCKE